MLKAVLFDMDGVLVDTEPEYRRLVIRLGKKVGIKLTESELYAYMGHSVREMWAALKEKYGFAQDPDALVQMENSVMGDYYEKGPLCPIAPSVALLKSCAQRGLKVAIATSSVGENAQSVVRRLGLGAYVQAVSSACRVQKAKPAPDIFLLAARLLGVEASECVVIEDAQSGVQAARAAGMKVVGFRPPGGVADVSAADIVAASLDEITPDTLCALLAG